VVRRSELSGFFHHHCIDLGGWRMVAASALGFALTAYVAYRYLQGWNKGYQLFTLDPEG
jgi:hypothetical protein